MKATFKFAKVLRSSPDVSVSSTRPSPLTLGDIAVGESCQVVAVRGDRRAALRLLEMGLVPGTVVELRRVAPLGDPLELRIRGYALSVRRTEAAVVDVSRP